MPDDTETRSGQDRERINVNQDYELRYWTKELGVSAEQLKQAVDAVGDRVEKVREYLTSDRSLD